MEKKTLKKKHRKYDADFKAEALRQVSNGRSIPDVAKSLGIAENLLYNWRAHQKSQMSTTDMNTTSELELLRKQLKAVETERDILKKALYIVGRIT
jgi:transposase